MRLRLFWTTLLAFAAVIVLGIGGMVTFFSLAFTRDWQPSTVREGMDNVQQTYALALGDYYTVHDGWNGVDQRLDAPPLTGENSFFSYVLVDAEGQVIASDDPALRPGRVPEARQLRGAAPVTVNGRAVGQFLLRSDFGSRNPVRSTPTPAAAPFLQDIRRAFFNAGLALMVVLLTLAVIFSTWVSRPIRRLTIGARQLAAGELTVQVPGSTLRELDDLAQSFNAMAASLADADRQRRQQTADIAHELRTPLTIIKGRLEGLEDGVYQPTPAEFATLLRETALLERLIEDLRLLALADAGQLPIDREPIAARDLLERAAATFAASAAQQGVTLRISAAADLPPISADPQRLAQVLNNLVSNALRHTPSGGEIALAAGLESKPEERRLLAADQRRATVLDAGTSLLRLEDRTAKTAAPLLTISVRDTGSGIAAADLPLIFDRFWRADRARTRASGGTGLGLAIARQIVEAHGGTISATSAVGQGTTITINLPTTVP